MNSESVTDLSLSFFSGTYCPLGSSEPTGCDLGKYCNADAMNASRAFCMAGYYCNANSTTDRPTGTGGQSLTKLEN